MSGPYPFKSAGADVRIFEPVAIMGAERIELASHIWLSEFSFLNAGQGLYIGNFVHVANHASIIGGGFCILDDFAGLSAGARIITGSADLDAGLANPMIPAEFGATYRSHVILEKHALLSTNAVVHAGVTIGEGAVVASNSVVTRDLEPWGIYIGAPARRVKDRNRQNLLDKAARLYEQSGIEPTDYAAVRARLQAAASD